MVYWDIHWYYCINMVFVCLDAIWLEYWSTNYHRSYGLSKGYNDGDCWNNGRSTWNAYRNQNKYQVNVFCELTPQQMAFNCNLCRARDTIRCRLHSFFQPYF